MEVSLENISNSKQEYHFVHQDCLYLLATVRGQYGFSYEYHGKLMLFVPPPTAG